MNGILCVGGWRGFLALKNKQALDVKNLVNEGKKGWCGGTGYFATTGVGATSFPHLSQKVAYPGICDLQFGHGLSRRPFDLMYWCILLVSSV
jgi:hypothetical protein